MLPCRKEKFAVTDGDPIFEVHYLGHRKTELPYGRGCTTEVVTELWAYCDSPKSLTKAFIQPGLHGMRLSIVNKRSGKPNITTHDIKDISYCCVENGINDRIFAWVHREPDIEPDSSQVNGKTQNMTADPKMNGTDDSKELPTETKSNGVAPTVDNDDDEITRAFLRGEQPKKPTYHFECYAVLASKSSRAYSIASAMSRAFHVAYKDWKLDRSRSNRSLLLKSLTERDLQTMHPRCKTDSGIGDFEETSSLASSTHPVLRCASDAGSQASTSSTPM